MAYGRKSGILHRPAAHTEATVNTEDVIVDAAGAGHIVIDITNFISGTYTFTVQARDPASGKYYNLITSAALGANGTTVLKIGPGLGPVSNVAVDDVLPSNFRVQAAGASTPSMTFSVGYLLA